MTDYQQHQQVKARDPDFWNVLKCNFQNWKIDPIWKMNPSAYHLNYSRIFEPQAESVDRIWSFDWPNDSVFLISGHEIKEKVKPIHFKVKWGHF